MGSSVFAEAKVRDLQSTDCGCSCGMNHNDFLPAEDTGKCMVLMVEMQKAYLS